MNNTIVRKDIPGFEHHFADTKHTRLHYVTGGTGAETLLLLHGFTESWYEWRKMLPLLASQYKIVAPDMRGLGDSAKTNENFDVESVAGDILELLQQLGLDRLKVVAHDWGGPVAYTLTALQPEMVEKLVIIEAALPGEGWEQGWDFRQGWSMQWFIPFLATPTLPARLVAGHEREFLSYFYTGFCFNKNGMEQEATDEYVRVCSQPNGMDASFGYYRDVYKSVEQIKKLAKSKLKMPVLAVGGAMSFKDLVETSLRNVAENVRGVIIPECGHFVPEEQPEKLTAEIETFFNEK